MHEGKGLSAWQLTMLALGTVVGGSFFLGTAIAIKASGPVILLAYMLGGVLVYLILVALSEMTVANPYPGSFRTYSEKLLGPLAGFVVGWVYWTGLVLAMSSEAVAASLFLKTWIPGLSTPILAISIVVGVTLLNLLGSRTLSNLESGLAAIKLAALVGFIGLALALIVGLFPGRAPVGLGVLGTEAFLPAGLGGVAGSMLIVIFSYAGFEIIGLAASEANNPHKTVPRAISYTVIGLVGLYTLVMAFLLPLVPTQGLSLDASPMVSALTARGLGTVAGSINVILVTAILSTMLAATFGLGRMARSLAESGNAPPLLIDRGEVPYRGILFSGVSMLAAVSLSYVLPKNIYIFLVSSGGFGLLFTYVVILFTHYRFRAVFGCPPAGHCQLKYFPYASWLAIGSLMVIIITMPLIPGQGSGLFAGALLVLLYVAAFLLVKVLPGYGGRRFASVPVLKLLGPESPIAERDEGTETSDEKGQQQ